MAGALALRVYRSDGSRSFIALDGHGELAAQRADGTEVALPMTGVVHG